MKTACDRHEITHDDDTIQYQQCKFCVKIQLSLPHHIASAHVKKKTIKCACCNAEFAWMQKLPLHSRQDHELSQGSDTQFKKKKILITARVKRRRWVKI